MRGVLEELEEKIVVEEKKIAREVQRGRQVSGEMEKLEDGRYVL